MRVNSSFQRSSCRISATNEAGAYDESGERDQCQCEFSFHCNCISFRGLSIGQSLVCAVSQPLRRTVFRKTIISVPKFLLDRRTEPNINCSGKICASQRVHVAMITRTIFLAAIVCATLLTANAQDGSQHRHEPQ